MIDFVASPVLADGEADVLAVPVFGERTWGPGAEWVVDRLAGRLDDYLESVEFYGSLGDVAVVPGGHGMPYLRVVFVGLGDEVGVEQLRQAAAAVGRATSRSSSVVTTLHQVDVDDAVEAVVFGILLGQYSFDRYRSEPKPARTETVGFAGTSEADLTEPVRRGRIVADAVRFARDLVNMPAGSKPPAELAALAAEMASERGVAFTIYDEGDLETERFGGLAAVAAGATNPPRLVVLDHAPEGATTTLALVGKGIVFDSGGLSLKSASNMEQMKTDMAGAATVFAAIKAVAEMGLELRVLAIAPLAENMPGGNAQRPGDVFTARNGKTVEVLNTDAEGRLVLADGLSLAVESEPDLVVDVATLTGACAVALGPKIGGLWSNDDAAAERVVAAAATAGEKVWRMPLEAEYRSHIESTVADMKNTGERYGGAIAAALILSEFVGDVPWVHLDMAGPARSKSAEHYLTPGGTGFGVRSLVALAEDLATNGADG